MRRVVLVGWVMAGLWVGGCSPRGTGTEESSSSSSSSGGGSTGGSSGLASSGGSSGVSTSGSLGSSSGGSSGITSSGGSSGDVSSSSSGGTCMDDCAEGEQVCDGTTGFKLCGRFDADSCLDLSQRIGCPGGYECTGGQCLAPCQNECPADSTLCQGTTHVLSCGNFDTDACLEPGGAVACGTGNHCESGACVPDTMACTDECTTSGTVTCFGNTRRTCGQFDADNCLDLGTPVACATTEMCQDGACVLTCTDECPLSGGRECNGDGNRTCGNFDADTCLEWSNVTSCTGGTFCDQGNCVQSCSDACATSGAVLCTTDNSGTQTCGNFDADSCLDLSSAVPCPSNHACSNGTCVPTCLDECQLTDAARCSAVGQAVERCGNFDADGCLEFGGAQDCTGGATCTNGSCNIPCTDDCAVGAVDCSNNGTRTCGQFDLDACRDWSAPSPCQSFEVCNAGACDLGPTPDDIVINEIVYDSVGGDTAAGTTTVYVELFGPAGAPLDGWEVVGVNGNGGGDYKRIPLDGESMGADGFFLMAYPNGAPAIVAAADLLVTAVDYENGPDNVQLRWRSRNVDALGYGTFSGSNVFAGEGTAAPSAPAGQALSRNATHADTNNNSVDFTVSDASPRGNPVPCTNTCPTAGLTQCSGTQVQTCGNFDADTCLEWDAAANCPTAGEICSGTACVPGCTNDCPSTGATQCSGQQVQSCGNFDADTCLEWGTAAACPVGGEICSNGACSVPCTNDCPSTGATQCSGQQVQSCGNFDADSCLEWGTAAACPNAGEVCGNGACTIPCNNDCPVAGATQCSGTQVQLCGNNDADTCLEWLAPSACPSMQACVMGSCQQANAPEVVLITPQGAVQTTQGATIRMLVDATPAPGRTITEVRFLANGVSQNVTMTAPHQFNYLVPANAATGSTITLTAQAVDNQGVTGTSVASYLNVRNDAPNATFTAVISTATSYTVDASAANDTETSQGALEVCWDWDNSGTCDTPFSTTKIATHDVGMNPSGTYTIRMVVRDAVGQTAETTRQVTFTNVQFIGGQTITTTLWYGTIVITGDVVVGAGQTLTIDAGTQVLFVRADVDSNGVGDYTITVEGTLVTNGTAANPVVFTGQNTAAKVPGGWDTIVLNGAGSSLTHTIIEYADTGLQANRANISLNNVTIRKIRGDGLALNNADTFTMTDTTITESGASGVWVHSGSDPVSMVRPNIFGNGHGMWVDNSSVVSISGGSISNNRNDGVHAHNATVNIQDAVVENNAWTGLAYSGNALGAATRNQLRQNGREGLLLETTQSGSPNPVVTLNNIYSNAVTGSRRISRETVSISASYTCCSAAGSTSAAYAPGAGRYVRRVLVSYDEAVSSSYVLGYVLDGSNNSVLHTLTTDFSGWLELPVNLQSVKVRVVDSGYSSATDTISITQADVTNWDGATDVSSDVNAGTINVTRNYLGTWPNVLGRVGLLQQQNVDLQGFVGVPFDNTWSTGPYKSGTLAAESWSGTVYITGNVTIPAGNTITVQPGAMVQFVAHDQNNDGVGDFSIHANGPLNAAGSAANRVRFMSYGAPAIPSFQTVNLNGTGANTSTWSQVRVENGNRAVHLRGPSALSNVDVVDANWDGIVLEGSGAAQLTDVNVTGAAGLGILLSNADNAALTRVVVDGSGLEGVAVTDGTTGATLSRLTSRNNVSDGLFILSGSTVTVEDSTLRDNGAAGVHIRDSSPTVRYSLLTYNHGSGLRVEGAANPALDHNVVKFNDDAGLVVLSSSAGNPVPVVQYNNIYGNSVTGALRFVTVAGGISASYTCCSAAGSTSGAYTAPGGSSIMRVYISYDEAVSSSYVNGYLLNGADNSILQTFSTDFSGWVAVPPGVTSVKVRVVDSGYSSATDTISATQVEYAQVAPASVSEAVVRTDSGTTDGRFNYWTADVGNVPNLIHEPRAGSLNYTGFTGFEYPSTGVNGVGPRP